MTRALGLMAMLALPGVAAAQDDTLVRADDCRVDPSLCIITHNPSLDEIVVTGAGGLPPENFDRVIGHHSIEEGGNGLGLRLENQLRGEAGLAQFRRSDARSAHPTSQGITLRGLGGNASSRALVLLDGIPQADPFGGWVAWSAFDHVNLRDVVVHRGGGSGVDGAGALAGTINLYSSQALGGGVAVGGGSFGASDAVFSIGENLGDGRVSLDGRWMRGDGFIPIVADDRGAVDRRAPFSQAGLGMRISTPVGRFERIEVSVRGWRDRRDRGTDFSRTAIDGLDASIRYLVDPTPFAGWQASVLGYVQLRELDTGFASVSVDRSSVAPALYQRVPAMGLGARIELRPPSGQDNPLRFGMDWRRVEGSTQESFFFTGTVPGRARVARGSSDTIGFFADWAAERGNILVNISGRLDHWKIAQASRVERNIGGSVRSDERFPARSGWEASARGGVRYDAGEFNLRGAAYTGWRLPTLNELYRPFRVGADATAANEGLRPERLIGGEVGADWFAGDVRVWLTGYWNHLDDAIANVTLGRGPGNFPGVGFVAAGGSYAQRQNVDAIRAQGVEARVSIDLGAVELAASYALTDARVRAAGAARALDGKAPAQVARHFGNLTVKYNEGPAFIALRGRYLGAQNEDDLGLQQLDDAITADLTASFKLFETREGDKKIYFDIRVENMFDALVPAAIGAGGAIERASPRSLWMGLSVNF